MFNSTCIENCPDNYYHPLNVENNIVCAECLVGCKKCIFVDLQQLCLSCDPGYYY